MPLLTTEQWLKRLMELERPHEASILAFYEHRIGGICCDPRLLLIPLDDHLVHRGDGVFETLLYGENKMYVLDAHVKRLENSAKGISLTPPCPWEEVREIIIDVAKAGGKPQGCIRVLMGRGPGGFGIDPAESTASSLHVVAYNDHPLPENLLRKGLSACRSVVPVRDAMFARLKTTNYLSGVLMSLEAAQKGVDIAFSFDTDGHLGEAAIANVAVVNAEGTLLIPEFRNTLPGTTALKAAELARPFMEVRVCHIPEATMFKAREILVLGTSRHACVGVTTYEGHIIGDGQPGPVAERLRTLILDDLQRHGTPLY